MKFLADLHIHSHFSRATSKQLDLEHIYIAAQKKGIGVVGTGDFTHPGWFDTLKTKLQPVESGLFMLDPEIAKQCDPHVPPSCRNPVRFMLSTELSSIYKKNGKTRKVHSLIFLPTLSSVFKFNRRLEKIGNLTADGRPILGLDVKHLLEILLEVSDESFMIPAHIWTPWFSLFGSKSGFDSLTECFEDLSSSIFAVETGLSSDPTMNWRIKELDHMTIISNSDAHSPMNLGREANIFNTELSYDAIRNALKTGNPEQFLGTIEFYSEEGKYHYDGHRNCEVNFHPEQSKAHHDRCPVCGKPLTLGVLHRVEELAGRPYGEHAENTHPYDSLIPLMEILSELLEVGVKSQKVMQTYSHIIEHIGPELNVLREISIDTIQKLNIPLLGLAIHRMREKQVHIVPGYDGEYGKIKTFAPGERKRLQKTESIFILPTDPSHVYEPSTKTPKPITQIAESGWAPKSISTLQEKNTEQDQAISAPDIPLVIIAGPGTGKTYTLTQRIAWMIQKHSMVPDRILAVTFTHKAADEMKERLSHLLTEFNSFPQMGTFHAFCLQVLKTQAARSITYSHWSSYRVINDTEQSHLIREAIKRFPNCMPALKNRPERIERMIAYAKQHIISHDHDLFPIVKQYYPEDHVDIQNITLEFQSIYQIYQRLLQIQHLFDYEDLVYLTVQLLENNPEIQSFYVDQYQSIFVDEFQDINEGQYRLIRALAPFSKNLCIIGDPDQSIYGFRGASAEHFNRFKNDYPDALEIQLKRNYRSVETILEASHQVIAKNKLGEDSIRIYSGIHGIQTIRIMEFATEKAEATAVGKLIEQWIGGTGFHSMDFGKVDGYEPSYEFAFSDFAVLYRTYAQGLIVSEIFSKAGIPHQLLSRENIFERQWISDLLCVFRLTHNESLYSDLDTWMRLNNITVSKLVYEVFITWAYNQSYSLTEALDNIAEFQVVATDYITELPNITQCSKRLTHLKHEIQGVNISDQLTRLLQEPGISNAFNQDHDATEYLTYLMDIAQKAGSDVHLFTALLALQADVDPYEKKAQKVALLTMHAAKGLEFPVVFIIGCEDGLIPYHLPETACEHIEEERRLFYVAMTRAKDALFLSHVNQRKRFGQLYTPKLSDFILDIESRLQSQEQVKKYKKESPSVTDSRNRHQLELF
ncbi:MAG: UvrD-helicase domain-containing protein [Desulfobacterales bacterium]|nr:UvrD-helicase domain-containing protein [Desulfobacterales bacterium]